MTVKIWDVTTNACIATIDLSRWIENMSFDNTGSHLNTDIGAIDLNASSALNTVVAGTLHQKPQLLGYGLSVDNSWITCNSKNVLWLPPEYRPSASAVEASIVVIGCSSGRVLMFKFSHNPPVV
jgi:hypothetical protein